MNSLGTGGLEARSDHDGRKMSGLGGGRKDKCWQERFLVPGCSRVGSLEYDGPIDG